MLLETKKITLRKNGNFAITKIVFFENNKKKTLFNIETENKKIAIDYDLASQLKLAPSNEFKILATECFLT